jgi:uncharacterized membrane protein
LAAGTDVASVNLSFAAAQLHSVRPAGRAVMSLRVKAELMLVSICVIWGLSFIVVKDALSYASPLAFIAIRFILAGVTSAIVLRGGVRRFTWDLLRAGTVLGLCLLGGYVLQVSGLLWTTPRSRPLSRPSAWFWCQ